MVEAIDVSSGLPTQRLFGFLPVWSAPCHLNRGAVSGLLPSLVPLDFTDVIMCALVKSREASGAEQYDTDWCSSQQHTCADLRC